jgi:CBS domain containing-hemolysin-like protein
MVRRYLWNYHNRGYRRRAFGEIEDEHDSDETLIEEELGEDTYLFSARFDVEYLNQAYKLQIPESDSLWYAGRLYCRFHKEIPLKGEVITIGTIIL